MGGRKRDVIAASLVRGQKRFEAWRQVRALGARIPDPLWSLAVRLAQKHGLSRTASTLRLDYHTLKNRMEAEVCDSSDFSEAFVEVAMPSPVSECVIEVEDGSGARMRVQLRGCEVPDLAALCQNFRRGE